MSLLRFSAVTQVGLALALLSMTACHPVDWVKQRFLRKMDKAGYVQKTVVLGPDTVTYWDNHSQKPVLILAHGFGGGGTWSWTKQFLELGQHFRVLSPDFLWFQDSFSSEPDYSLAHQAKMLAALLAHLNIDKAHILGTSYGGLVAYRLALLAPEKVDRIIFAASPGPDYNAQDYEAMCDRLGIEHLGELLLVDDAEDFQFLVDSIYYEPKWMPTWAQKKVVAQHYARHRTERGKLLNQVIQGAVAFGEFRFAHWSSRFDFVRRRGFVVSSFAGQTLSGLPREKRRLQSNSKGAARGAIERPELFNRHVLSFLGAP